MVSITESTPSIYLGDNKRSRAVLRHVAVSMWDANSGRGLELAMHEDLRVCRNVAAASQVESNCFVGSKKARRRAEVSMKSCAKELWRLPRGVTTDNNIEQNYQNY